MANKYTLLLISCLLLVGVSISTEQTEDKCTAALEYPYCTKGSHPSNNNCHCIPNTENCSVYNTVRNACMECDTDYYIDTNAEYGGYCKYAGPRKVMRIVLICLGVLL